MKHDRNSRLPFVFASLALSGLVLILSLLLKDADIALLHPKGFIADEQQWLLVISTLTMLAFALPVIFVIYFFAWKYREGNSSPAAASESKISNAFLLFAWGGPIATVAVLAFLMLPATQRLEPQAPIINTNEQMTIQVIALNWKWLFIYPEQDIATLNYVQIPVDTPVRFELTADEAPMSSFWIPHLGGMLYAMTGHVNRLHLIGDTVGDYPGSSAEINGKGFAGMKFTARVSTQNDFDSWLEMVTARPDRLTEQAYEKILEPSEYEEPVFFSSVHPELFDSVIDKYKDGHVHSNGNERYGE